MIRQCIALGLLIFVSPLMPPILVPMGYSFTGVLLLQNVDPRILSFISVVAATLSTVAIRIIQNHVIEKLKVYDEIESIHRYHRGAKRINKFFREQKSIQKAGEKRGQYVQTKRGKVMTFLFAIFCYLPVIPDIISTRLLYKKIRFPYFVLAVIIGKSITHIPFVFVGKSIIQIILSGF